MIKKRILYIAFSWISFTQVLIADDFQIFLQKAINQNSYLKSSYLSINQAQEENSKLLRYKNPSLGFEYSNNSKNDSSYVASYSQPMRLWGIEKEKRNLGQAVIQSAKSQYNIDLANFIKNISMAYTKYNEYQKLLKLGKEEINIAKKIYDISKSKYEEGTISQAVMLQSKVAYMTLEEQNDSLSLEAIQSYYELLKYAGIKEEILLEPDYNFYTNKNINIEKNPYLLSLKDLEKKSNLNTIVNSNKIEWIDLYAEYEKDSDQDISRLGLNIPLTIFNTKSEEKMFSKIEAQKKALLVENKIAQLNIDILRLTKELNALFKRQIKNKLILQTEEELLMMFIQRYKISQSNLLELQDVKNKVIQTKKRLIKINTALNQNAINKNYLQGNYNE